MLKYILKAFFLNITKILVLSCIVSLTCLWIFYEFGRGLPSCDSLSQYEPPTVSRFYTDTGKLIYEHSNQKRLFIPIKYIPKRIIYTFLAAEDREFFQHIGISPLSIIRACSKNAFNRKRPQGASTITQQVAKNFLLNNDVTYKRKIQEAILSIRIEQTFSKEKILELYLNEIYLGLGTYGIASAALYYFNKTLEELSVEEAAFLAGIPKSPSFYHPFRAPKQATERRNYVINKMTGINLITPIQAEEAKKQAIKISFKKNPGNICPYIIEEVKRKALKILGNDISLKGGYLVKTTVNENIQRICNDVFDKYILEYDMERGWRGPFKNIEFNENWKEAISHELPPYNIQPWKIGIVIDSNLKIGLQDGREVELKSHNINWIGNKILHKGDIIFIEEKNDEIFLRQIPKISGSMIAIDINNGRILAIKGGYSFKMSQFNRATQAFRQPGSALKTFVYLSAFEHGMSPEDKISDDKIYIRLPNGKIWSPKNFDNKRKYGIVSLKYALQKSLNRAPVRLTQKIGIKSLQEILKRFGIMDKVPNHLSVVLGSKETTLERLTSAYAMIANGGKRIYPSVIDFIQDRYGKVIYKHNLSEEIISDKKSIDTMKEILEDSVKNGTGRNAFVDGYKIIGKTGSSNESKDVWFIGVIDNIAVGITFGFDNPESLGKEASGGRTAAPAFKSFVLEYIKKT
jgi:penicillin-binding protein 1A